jgi:hypothetical protein
LVTRRLVALGCFSRLEAGDVYEHTVSTMKTTFCPAQTSCVYSGTTKEGKGSERSYSERGALSTQHTEASEAPCKTNTVLSNPSAPADWCDTEAHGTACKTYQTRQTSGPTDAAYEIAYKTASKLPARCATIPLLSPLLFRHLHQRIRRQDDQANFLQPQS